MQPTDGSVTVGGFPAGSALRGNFMYVPQGNTLLSGTIRSNLLLAAPQASEEELREVLSLAQASFVLDLPQGLDTPCGEVGSGLSEGQAQRIAVARALLRPGGVLILDESTSALDAATEERLIQTLHSRYHGRKTILFISHRPFAATLADAVVDFYAHTPTPVTDNNFMRDDLNISQIEMCDVVGGVAGTYCPKTVMAYFIPGKSPITESSVYRAIPIDNVTGRRACNPDPKTTHMAVYEFWDAEYLDMFKRAGIHRNTPPPYMENCDLNTVSESGTAPIITSPADNTRIVITDGRDVATVTFSAISDTPDTRIFLFLDDATIGHIQSGEIISRDVPMGNHTVRAIDETGTGTSYDFSVIK